MSVPLDLGRNLSRNSLIDPVECENPPRLRKNPQRLSDARITFERVAPAETIQIGRFRRWHESCKTLQGMAKRSHAPTNGSKRTAVAKGGVRPRVLIIEDNPLTFWAMERTLTAAYEVVRCTSLEQAQRELLRSPVLCVICGSPIADGRPEDLRRLAEVAGRKVVALVSDPDCRIAPNVRILEKPFDLNRLIDLLAHDPFSAVSTTKDSATSSAGTDSNGRTNMGTLAERLYARFEKEICSRCVHQTADGGCSLTDRRECPVFEWATQIAELVKDVDSNQLGDYLDRIQAIICPGCMQQPNGQCKSRNHLDCPLDLYLGLVVPIIEEELKRGCAA